jgi:hypothetical protein
LRNIDQLASTDPKNMVDRQKVFKALRQPDYINKAQAKRTFMPLLSGDSGNFASSLSAIKFIIINIFFRDKGPPQRMVKPLRDK